MTAEQETEVLEHAEAAPNGEAHDVEAKARRQGWRPKDEYKGTKPWIDAAEYLKNGEDLQPIMQERLRKQDKQLTELQTLIRDMTANQKAEQDRAVKRAVAALQAEKRTAVSEGDVAKVEALDAQIDDVKASAPVKQQPQQPAVGPEFIEWGERNTWFQSDPELRYAAIGAFERINRDDDTADLSDREKLRMVTKEIKTRYAERFGNPRRAEAQAVEGGNPAPRNGGGKKTWNDLPADVKPIAERIIAATKMTKEDYLKSYPW